MLDSIKVLIPSDEENQKPEEEEISLIETIDAPTDAQGNNNQGTGGFMCLFFSI